MAAQIALTSARAPKASGGNKATGSKGNVSAVAATGAVEVDVEESGTTTGGTSSSASATDAMTKQATNMNKSSGQGKEKNTQPQQVDRIFLEVPIAASKVSEHHQSPPLLAIIV
jgi:hypothetical protein